MKLLIIYNNVESFFAEINKVCKFERIDTKISGKLCFHRNVVRIDTKLFDQKLL